MKDGTIIDYDPLTGTIKRFYYDDATDTVTIKTVFNPAHTQDVIEANKRVQNMGKDAYRSITPGEVDMWHAASIPYSVQMKWLVEEGIDIRRADHWPAVKRKLNDPEYRHLRAGKFSL